MERLGVPAADRDRVPDAQRAGLQNAFERSETYAQSMRQKLRPMARGESIAGVLAFKHEIRGTTAAMVLIDDGKGTYHRAIVHDVGDIRKGNRVSLDYGRDMQARLTREPEQNRGMRFRM